MSFFAATTTRGLSLYDQACAALKTFLTSSSALRAMCLRRGCSWHDCPVRYQEPESNPGYCVPEDHPQSGPGRRLSDRQPPHAHTVLSEDDDRARREVIGDIGQVGQEHGGQPFEPTSGNSAYEYKRGGVSVVGSQQRTESQCRHSSESAPGPCHRGDDPRDLPELARSAHASRTRRPAASRVSAVGHSCLVADLDLARSQGAHDPQVQADPRLDLELDPLLRIRRGW